MATQLHPLEHAMLEQTYRFGLGRPELGVLIPQLSGTGDDAGDLLDALVDQGYLGQAVLYANFRYYFLAERVHQEFELEPHDRGPLKEREKILRYAMLRFCLQASSRSRPLTSSDFRHHFPHLYHARPVGNTQRKQSPRFRNYYLAENRLGLLRVDFGGSGRYDRILKSACSQIGLHQVLPPYAELIRGEAFELTIVTAFPTKANRLRADLQRRQTDVPIWIRVVPELRELIAPLPNPCPATE